MVPEQAIEIMYETANAYINSKFEELEGFTGEIINGDFPLVVEFEKRFYRGEFIATMLGDDH